MLVGTRLTFRVVEAGNLFEGTLVEVGRFLLAVTTDGHWFAPANGEPATAKFLAEHGAHGEWANTSKIKYAYGKETLYTYANLVHDLRVLEESEEEDPVRKGQPAREWQDSVKKAMLELVPDDLEPAKPSPTAEEVAGRMEELITGLLWLWAGVLRGKLNPAHVAVILAVGTREDEGEPYYRVVGELMQASGLSAALVRKIDSLID